jgi:ankyrin repeat protein
VRRRWKALHAPKPSQGGTTALMFAADNNHASTVDLLVSLGANLDDQDSVGRPRGLIASTHEWAPHAIGAQFGQTALIISATKGHRECVEALCRLGAARDKVAVRVAAASADVPS